MGCINRNKKGEVINVTAVNGNPSILFNSLIGIVGSTERAVKLYNEIRDPKWKEKFGRNWETETKIKAIDEFYLDKNGEPKLISGYGEYLFKSFKGPDIPLKLEETTESGFSSELESKVTDIAVSFIIDRIESTPEYFKDTKKVNAYFNTTKESEKGILAEDMLLQAFQGVEDPAIAKQLYDIHKKNPQILKDSLPVGVSISPIYKVFINIYDNWNDVINPRTNNTERFGWRSLIKDRLVDHGIKLKDDIEQIEEFEDAPAKIYGRSRLAESPINTLSDNSKALLGRIKQNEADAFYGYTTYLPVSEVYSVIANASVGENSFLNMKLNVQQEAKYKPYLLPIVEKLNNLTTQEQAVLFSNFRLAYNNFLLFTSKRTTAVINNKPETKTKTRMINSNQSNTKQKAFQKWRNQSIEENFITPRAPYKATRDKNGNQVLTIKPEKLKKLKTAFKNLDKLNSREELKDKHVDALATVVWELGMQYGDTYNQTKANLEKYFDLGHVKNINGKPILTKGSELYMNLVHSPNGVMELSRILENPNINIYNSNSRTINTLAGISHLFESKPFGSFITAMGKQVYPINLPTSLTEFRDNIKDSEALIKMIDERNNDPFFSPGTDIKYSSILLQSLLNSEEGNNKYIDEFNVHTLDSYKAASEILATSDYDNQSSKVSLIVRLNAFANSGNETYSKIAIPTQESRGRLDFVTMPRIDKLNKLGIQTDTDTILKGLVLQDLARIKQAYIQIKDAMENQDPSTLKEGYHYKEGSNPYAKDGSAFTMTQIFGLQDTIIDGNQDINIKMSDLVDDFIGGEESFIVSPEGMLFQDELNNKVKDIYDQLAKFKVDLKSKIKDYKINLVQDVELSEIGKEAQDKFLDNYILNDFIGRIELIKHLRGGISWAKNTADFYKRMGLLSTPGQMLFIKDENNENPDYGMMPTFREITIADFNFQNPQMANAVADNMKLNLHASFLKQGYDEVTANVKSIQIADKYRNVNKTDAQGFISLDMYRGIQMGLGQWNKILDEQAYKNAKKTDGDYAGQFVDNNGNPRTIAPIKPYYEDLSLRNKTMTMTMNKNSYMTITPELAANYPMFKLILDKMDSGVEVINTRSATKGSRQNVINVQQEGNLDNAKVITMDSTKLRLPQIYPITKKPKINFSIQVRKGLIANLKRDQIYNLDGYGPLDGQALYNLYHNLISENVSKDLIGLKNELGLNNLESAVEEFGFESLQYKEAKLEHLKQIKGRLKEHIKEKGLGKNYLKALDIVPNGQYDYDFKIPLAFPNYQAKFEQAIMSMFNKNVIKQSIRGGDFVQIAELGGYTEEVGADVTSFQEELDFYDGIHPAQIRIKASALGIEPGTDIKTVQNPLTGDPKLLQLIGYRTPNQGKNSTLAMEVVGFLPESHSKAVMVPGGITVQMGSDFDIDKLSIMLPNQKNKKRIAPDHNKKISNMSRPMRDNAIMDIYQTIMMSEHHMDEVVTPLDDDVLNRLSAKIRALTEVDLNVNYNHPLAEIQMEERMKLGAALTGLWANQLSGRNVAETGNMTIDAAYTPSIVYNGQEVEFSNLGVQRSFDATTGQFNGDYTDKNINLFLTAALDAGKNPIQIDLNDNIYTVPVSGLLLNAGMPVEDVIYFLAQPSIKKAVEHATNEDKGLNGFVQSIDKITKEFGKQDYLDSNFNLRTAFPEMTPMDQALLRQDLKADITKEEDGMRQLGYLNNFKRLFLAGKQLQTINKIITPDNIKNINELSSIMSWLETENRHLRDSNNELIHGANELITKNEIGNPSLNPIASTFRSVFDSILSSTAEMGFINNRDSFHKFKKGIRAALGSFSLTAPQHKFIDRTLFLNLMTRNNSPLVRSNIISKNTFNSLYINKGSNIVSRLTNIKSKYENIKNNPFVASLQPHPSNNNSPYFLIQLDTSFDMSSTVKDSLSTGLLDLLKSPEKYVNDKNNSEEIKEIKDFGKLLIANQIFTTGFSPGYGTYIDLIHPEILTDKTLLFENQDMESLVEFFKRESKDTFNHNYFAQSNEIHNFVRNFGLSKPGGSSFLKSIPYNNLKTQLNSPNYNGEIQVAIGNPGIYNDTLGYLDYFKTNNFETGDTKVFMRSDIILQGNSAIYTEIQLAGIPSKLNEVNILNEDTNSSIHQGGITNPVLGLNFITKLSEDISKNSEQNPEQQPFKACQS